MKKFKNSFVVTGSIPLLKAFISEALNLGWTSDEPWNTDHPLQGNMKYIEFVEGIYYYHNHDCSPTILYTLPNNWSEVLKLASEVEEEVVKVPEYVKCTKNGLFVSLTDVVKESIWKTDTKGYSQGNYRIVWKDGSGQMIPEGYKQYFIPSSKSEYDAQELEYKKQELLSEAKRRFKKGDNVFRNFPEYSSVYINCTSEMNHCEPEYEEDKDAIRMGGGIVYSKGVWAEIVKDEFKVGDWVVATVNTFTQAEFEVEIGTITKITQITSDKELWLDCIPDGEGVANPKDFRLATPEEIAKVKEDTIEIAGYKAKFSDEFCIKEVAFGCKKFSNDELRAIRRVNELSISKGIDLKFEGCQGFTIFYDDEEYIVSDTVMDKLIKKTE